VVAEKFVTKSLTPNPSPKGRGQQKNYLLKIIKIKLESFSL
jgi:hypothetical protein